MSGSVDRAKEQLRNLRQKLQSRSIAWLGNPTLIDQELPEIVDDLATILLVLLDESVEVQHGGGK